MLRMIRYECWVFFTLSRILFIADGLYRTLCIGLESKLGILRFEKYSKIAKKISHNELHIAHRFKQRHKLKNNFFRLDIFG